MHVCTFTCYCHHIHWYCILHLVIASIGIIPPSFPFSSFFLSRSLPPFLPFSLLSSPAQEEQDSHIIHANPMPQFDSVFKPQLPHKTTEIQPFTFEERYQGKPTRETLVQQILQKEKVQCMDPDTCTFSQNFHYIGRGISAICVLGTRMGRPRSQPLFLKTRR